MENFYLDGYLKEKLDNVKRIIKKNWDCVILIDGKERAGKSTLGFTCAWYLSDGTITIENLAKDTDDAIKKIETLPDKSILMIDEGSLSFSSKDAMRNEQKKIMKILDVVGQKNLTIIIILPSFFELAKAIAVRRSRFLLHVYTDEELMRGRFAYFGEQTKPKLYDYGRKNFGSYDFPEADFVGRFTDFKVPFFEQYLLLKKASLLSALKTEIKIPKQNIRITNMRNILAAHIYGKQWMTQTEIRELFASGDIVLDKTSISEMIHNGKSILSRDVDKSKVDSSPDYNIKLRAGDENDDEPEKEGDSPIV